MFLSWSDERHYEQLGARYAAPHLYPYTSRLEWLAKEVERNTPAYGRLREFYQSDLQAYRERLNREGDPLAFAGEAALLQKNFHLTLKAAKKIRPLQKAIRAANMHGKHYAPWFEGVLLRFDNYGLSISTLTVTDDDGVAWITSIVRCGSRIDTPFRVFVPFDALYSTVRLMDDLRIDLRYRWLVNVLEVRQGERGNGRYDFQARFKCIDLDSVPMGEQLKYL